MIAVSLLGMKQVRSRILPIQLVYCFMLVLNVLLAEVFGCARVRQFVTTVH
jgi:hypothetical protein